MSDKVVAGAMVLLLLYMLFVGVVEIAKGVAWIRWAF